MVENKIEARIKEFKMMKDAFEASKKKYTVFAEEYSEKIEVIETIISGLEAERKLAKMNFEGEQINDRGDEL